MTTSKEKSHSDRNKIAALSEILSYNFDELFISLGIKLSKNCKFYVGCCPIHGGDNHSAFNLYPEGYALRGYWKCRTHQCHTIFKSTPIGFVRGILSAQKLGWSQLEDKSKVYGFKQTIDWICNFLGKNFADIKPDAELVERKNFVNTINTLAKLPNQPDYGLDKSIVRKHLEMPAKFFINRGFAKDILDKYDVGLSKNIKKEMYNRVVVPIYENTGKYMVGFTGRSIYNRCEKCQLFHHELKRCPDTPQEKFLCSKWKNASHSRTSSYLYNYWFAAKPIKQEKTVVVVEGPPDVWKLEEAGIHNSVAIFGTTISDEQQVILEMSGATNIVIMLDSDKAGEAGIKKIEDAFKRICNVHTLSLSAKDPGDASVDTIKKELIPLLNKVKTK